MNWYGVSRRSDRAAFNFHNDRKFNYGSVASCRARIGGVFGGCYCWPVVEPAHDPVQVLL